MNLVNVMTNDATIRVLLVDDHTVVRNGVRMMLASDECISVEGEVENAAEAMRLLQMHSYHVALVDIALPGMGGMDLLKQMKIQYPAMAVLILSMYSEEVYAVRALKLGAAGYLTKNSPQQVLLAAVHRAAEGGKYISTTLATQFADMLGASGNLVPHDSLSNRELEVMKLIACGTSLVQIATSLHLSPSTVTTYRARILEKMGMKTNMELARYATQHGLLL